MIRFICFLFGGEPNINTLPDAELMQDRRYSTGGNRYDIQDDLGQFQLDNHHKN